MKQKQILRASIIVALGTVQIAPCLMMFCEPLAGFAAGVLYTTILSWFWHSTIIGRKFFREFYRSTLRLENYLLPPLEKL